MKIYRAFRSRHPICAALIGFLLGPSLVMFYLGRWKPAMWYCVPAVALFGVEKWAEISFPGLNAVYIVVLLALAAFNLLGAVHGYQIARSLPVAHTFPWYARWYNIVLVSFIAPLALALLARSLLFQPFNIVSSAMFPTLREGDYVMTSKFAYGYGKYSFLFHSGPASKFFGRTPERGDIVVLAFPPNPEIDYVERVIGLPGDRVQMKDGILHLNGKPVPRYEIKTLPNGPDFPITIYRETLPNGLDHFIAENGDLLRSDNTAEFVVPVGHYFVMGDNRDNSADSRYDVGFVPEENIYAKVVAVFFNKHSGFDRFGTVGGAFE
ncbi:signal peptidase I [Ensifer sp. IC3342]|nr:signal peptidase I [Ensifer sp. BRP08]MCA1447051.1 signal peptidase I [Ensifer sp. IC3342]